MAFAVYMISGDFCPMAFDIDCYWRSHCLLASLRQPYTTAIYSIVDSYWFLISLFLLSINAVGRIYAIKNTNITVLTSLLLVFARASQKAILLCRNRSGTHRNKVWIVNCGSVNYQLALPGFWRSQNLRIRSD